MMQHDEVLRVQMVTGEGESMLTPRKTSVGLLISQGIIAWSTLWDSSNQEMTPGSRVSEQTPDSGSEARGSVDMESELRNILVTLT